MKLKLGSMVWCYSLILFFFLQRSQTQAAPSCTHCVLELVEVAEICPTCESGYCQECVTQGWFFAHLDACGPVYSFEGLKQLPEEALSELNQKVVIRVSRLPGAGRGLFARVKIQAGEPVCFQSGRRYPDEPGRLGLSFFHFDRLTRNPYTQSYIDHSDCLVTEPHPHHSGLAGQLANDPFFNHEDLSVLRALTKPSLLQRELKQIAGIAERYLEKSLDLESRKKIGIRPILGGEALRYQNLDLLGFEASRRIEQGEEIYWMYGLNYWASKILLPCFRKGLVIQAIVINRAFSYGVEKAIAKFYQNHQVPQTPFSLNEIRKNCYSHYVTQELAKRSRSLIEDNLISTQIPALFCHQTRFRMLIQDEKACQDLFEDLGFVTRLKQIASLTPDEFSSPFPQSYELLHYLQELLKTTLEEGANERLLIEWPFLFVAEDSDGAQELTFEELYHNRRHKLMTLEQVIECLRRLNQTPSQREKTADSAF